MPPVSYLLTAFLLPAVIVAAALLFARWRWIGAVAFPIAFIIAEWAIHGHLPAAPGAEAGDWIVYFAAACLVLGVLDAIFQPSLPLRAGILFVMALVANQVLLSKLAIATPRELWDQQTFVYLAAAVATILWASMEGLCARSSGAVVMAIAAIESIGAVVLLGTETTVTASHGALALAAMTGAAMLVLLFRRGVSISRGPMLLVSFSLVELLTYTYFYGISLSTDCLWHGAAVLLAPVLAWAGDLPGIRRRAWSRTVARILPVMLAVGIVAAISARNYLAGQGSEQNPYGAEQE